MDLLTKYPGYFPFIFKKNFAELRNTVSVPLVIFALAGFFSGQSSKRLWAIRAFTVGALSPVCVLLTLFLISSAYIAPYVPLLLILSGQGLIATEAFIAARLGFERNGVRYVTALLVAVYALNGAYCKIPWTSPKPYVLEMDDGRYDQKLLGKLLKKQLPPGSTIMTRSGRIAFYSGLPWVDIPQADLQTILATAREKKVRYLIVHGELQFLRPQMAELLLPLMTARGGLEVYENGAEVIPGLFHLMNYTDEVTQGVVVYEFRQQ
jgi:hypothetical protein